MCCKGGAGGRAQPRVRRGNTVSNGIKVPASLAELIPAVRVAEAVEPSSARMAFMCRFYALNQSHKLDPTSSGEGVRQFKTELMQLLDKYIQAREKKIAEKSPKSGVSKVPPLDPNDANLALVKYPENDLAITIVEGSRDGQPGDDANGALKITTQSLPTSEESK